MKHMKKLVSLLLAMMMVLSMTAVASASMEGTLTGGSITINNAVSGQTYSIYQILYLESYDATNGNYAYKANSAWKTWLKGQTTYVTVDENDYVTWANVDTEGNPTGMEEFAKAALAYAKTQNDAAFNPDQTSTAASTTVNFTGLKLGYYLVDTTLGSLCALDTTKPSVTIQEKNKVPVPEKKIKEGEQYVDANTAKIGDTVEYRTTFTASKGAVGYVLHDKMDAGLTLNQNSIVVKAGQTTLTKDTHYTVAFSTLSDGCTFEITFAKSYLDTITADTTITVTYSAVLNENAVIYDSTNKNQTKLNYGDNSATSSEWDETTTTTYKFDVIKVDGDHKLLEGAKFELYDAQTGGTKIDLVKVSDGVYRVATAAEKNAEGGFTSAVIEAGKITVIGVKGNTSYWLEETEAPAGYNKLSARVEVKIESANLTTTMDDDLWEEEDGGIMIENKTGTILPSTGGMGATIFYVLGAALVLGAVVLLVVRKRMSAGN